jgi:superfamily II DNA/RNA helicase
VNFDAPDDKETYVHRVGRTGRAGRTGVGITFVLADQASDVAKIAGGLGLDHPFSQSTGSHRNPGPTGSQRHQGRRRRNRPAARSGRM